MGRRFMVLMLTLASCALAAEDAATINEKPAAYMKACRDNAAKHMTGKYTGDSWSWHARFPMDSFIDAYLASRDTAWLDAATGYFDSCIELLMVGPDGRKGWLGPAYRMPGRLGEYPLEDALVIGPMLRFSELVLKDEPALAEKYGTLARAYVKLGREMIFEKWDARGIWHEDGPYGAYTNWPWTFTEAAPDRWHAPPAGTAPGTLPINMQVHWGLAAARLWRITGEAAWHERAARIFNFAKSRLNLYDDHYSWNYWEPFGTWDLKPGNAQDYRSWINTHPYVNYQSGEVAAFVEAYHRGITFDETDMKRLVRTNLHVMWNGKLDDAQWNNSNAGVQKAALGEIRRGTPQSNGRWAGALWTALVPFDATARRLYEKQLTAGSTDNALYRNVTAAAPPSYARRYPAEKATPFAFPFRACSTITMVAVLPSTIRRGEVAVVGCQSRLPADLKIELRSADGEQLVAPLKETPIQLIFNLSWDTSDVAPGRYRVRWTVKGEYREFPIEVR